MLRSVRIPKERIPVLIGRNGAVKKEIEELANVKVRVGEEVEIKGEAIGVINAENIVRAIGRGFAPDKALYLLDEDYAFHSIQLPKNEKTLNRIRSRLIGTRGKARKNIEMLTRTFICVYGKTVSIIGKYDDVKKAAAAVEKLIQGRSHKFVYRSIGGKNG